MQRDGQGNGNNSIRSMASNSSDVDTSEFEDNITDEFSPDSDDNDVADDTVSTPEVGRA